MKLKEVHETFSKRTKKTGVIPEEHLVNAFTQQPASQGKRGQKRDRRKSDATSTQIRTTGLGGFEGSASPSDTSSLGPAEQRYLPSPSDGSNDPDAAAGASAQASTVSALESR